MVIYGLKEASNDLAKVRNLLKVCDCEDTVVHVIRLGKFSVRPDEVNFKQTGRLLKVELWSQSDRQIFFCSRPKEFANLHPERCILLNFLA